MKSPLERVVESARQAWTNTGARRPDFAREPGPGQESVWDYPRPPALVPDYRHVVVQHLDVVVASSHESLRVLETASPPTFYLPPDDVDTDLLRRESTRSFCEWKGEATYWSLALPDAVIRKVAWSYEAPYARFEAIAGYLAFYPGRLECLVDGERVKPQPGGFYGGWVTSEIVGPFKGAPGTGDW